MFTLNYSDVASNTFQHVSRVFAMISGMLYYIIDQKFYSIRKEVTYHMNNLVQEKWPWIEGSHGMRSQILGVLTDADLAFSPGGQNISLGAVCREMGDVEHSYIQSLKTFTQDWSYHNTEAGLETSVTRLNAWYEELDKEMNATLLAFSDEDVTKTVDRSGYPMSLPLQLDAYLQALMIFFGKATTYLKAMNKPLPETVQEWIG